ncbi:uncharacterized protein [Ptychodera flava]|uniref:uncharacterized protein n=1 Tax=Ptychodera flava TaxID=63121 RepID=UPI00396A99A6
MYFIVHPKHFYNGVISGHQGGEKHHQIDPFLSLLNKLSELIGNDDFKIMKNLCSNKLRKRELEGLVAPFDLFMALKERGFLSESSTEILIELFGEVGRCDLKECVGKFNGNDKIYTDISYGIAWLEDHLKELYVEHFNKFKPLPWIDAFSLYVSDVYTRLEVVKVDERGKEFKRKGSIKIRPTRSEGCVVSVNEVFGLSGSGRKAKRIRIEGPPAIGKSMFCRKLAYDWACGKFDQYKLAILLEVRHVQKMSIVDNIFDQLLPDDANISKEELTKFLSYNEDSILFIFDGLDEIDNSLKADNKLDLNRIIEKKILSKCTVVITSRPHECNSQLSGCDLHFNIYGFAAEDREKYMLKFFQQDKKAVEKLKQCISNLYIDDQNQESFLRNPLNVLFVCVLWEHQPDDESFPTKRTDLYTEILESILHRYCSKNDIDIGPDDSIDLVKGEVPSDIRTAVDTLAEIAYNTMREGKTLINESDIKPECLLSFGLLVRNYGISRLKPIKVCYFSHKTWLEYFAARFIATSDDPMKYMEYMFIDIERYYTVFTFVVGMLKANAGSLFEYFGKVMNKSLETSDIDETVVDFYFTFWLTLLNESNNCVQYLHYMEPVVSRLSHIMFTEVGEIDNGHPSSMYPKPFMCKRYSLCLHNYYENATFFFETAIEMLKYRHRKQGKNESDICLWLTADQMDEHWAERLVSELKANSVSLKCLILDVKGTNNCDNILQLLKTAIRETKVIKRFMLIDETDVDDDASMIGKIVESAAINKHIDELSMIVQSPCVKKIPIKLLEVNNSKRFLTNLDSSTESVELANALVKSTMHVKLRCFFIDFQEDIQSKLYNTFCYAVRLQESGLKSLAICSQLLDFSIIDAARESISLEDFQLSLHIDDVLSMSELIVTNRHIKSLVIYVSSLEARSVDFVEGHTTS